MRNLCAKILFSFTLLALCFTAQAQQFVGFGTVWNDDFSEWRLFIDDYEGLLTTVWQNDISEWRYEINEETYGTIRMKWKDDPSLWEIRGNDGTLITLRTIWPRNFREWRLTDNDITLDLKPKWSNINHEWEMDEKKHGSFLLSQDWDNDPREWTIEDEAPEVSAHMKMGLVFLTMWRSVPGW